MKDLDKVKQLINGDDVSNYQIAKELGISRGKLSSIKNGRINPENLTYKTVAELVAYYDKCELLGEDNMKFAELLKKNEEIVYGDNTVDFKDDAKQAKVVTTTIDEYSNYLSDRYPNVSDHNEQIMNDWGELLQEALTGEALLYNFEDTDDDDFAPELTKDAIAYINQYGDGTYYNEPYTDDDGVWHVSVMNERDIMTIIDSYDRFKF